MNLKHNELRKQHALRHVQNKNKMKSIYLLLTREVNNVICMKQLII